MAQTRELIFLGTGASCGVPTYYCGCKACQEVKEHPEYARSCSSIAIKGAETTLIDTSPELRLQFVRESLTGCDRVLYTHDHFDHVGGLPQLEYYERLIAKGVLPVYASDVCSQYLKAHFDFMDDTFETHDIEVFKPMDFDGVRYTALPATHCPGAFGYLMGFGKTHVAYFPDCGPMVSETLESVRGVDILIIDATFNGKNWMPQAHTTIDGAIKLAGMLKPKVTYLTHLSQHFDEPITVAEIQAKLANAKAEYNVDVRLPFDGTRIVLSDDGCLA